jgi:hypothetical protein
MKTAGTLNIDNGTCCATINRECVQSSSLKPNLWTKLKRTLLGMFRDWVKSSDHIEACCQDIQTPKSGGSFRMHDVPWIAIR